MGFYADPWLREARDRIEPLQAAADNTSASDDFGRLAEAVEKAIKAALIESHGSLPKEHDHNKLVSICQNTGVWDVLPPALKGLVEEIEAFRLKQETATRSASAQDLQRYFFVARRLIDYMEFHVIGNDSVLKRLKVA